MKAALIFVILLVVLIAGFFIYKSYKQSNPTYRFPLGRSASSASSGDPQVDSALRDIDRQLNSLDNNTSSVDGGLNDRMGDLSSP